MNNQNQAPADTAAETALLGGILMAGDLFAKVSPYLRADDFFDPRHTKIYQAFEALAADDKPIDPITVADQLTSQKALELIGGKNYIQQLVGEIPTIANCRAYTAIILRQSLGRAYQSHGQNIDAGNREAAVKSQELVSNLFDRLAVLNGAAKELPPLAETAKAVIEALRERHKTKALPGIATGYPELDKLTGGWQPGHLTIIGGRTSTGKTALALNLAAKASQSQPVLFFALEMAASQLVIRLLSAEAFIASWSTTADHLTAGDLTKIEKTAERINGWRLLIDDTPGQTIAKLRNQIKATKPALIFVDHLGKIRPQRPGGSTYQEVSEVSRGLAELAREFNTPIIAACQVSRSPNKADNQARRLQLSDLRDSGAIEQDADIVGLINKTSHVDTKGETIELDIQKNRHGPTGVVKLAYHHQSQHISERNAQKTKPPADGGLS